MNSNQISFPDKIFIEFGVNRLKILMKWKEIVKRIYKATRELLGNVQIYVFGSIVEGKYTALSDIDVAIVMDKIPEKASDRAKIIDSILSKIEDICPWLECPVEIHLMTEIEKQIFEKGGTKFIKVEELIKNEK